MIAYPWFCDEYYEDDEFNISRQRNVKNTGKRNYNCGGYALGTFSWYQPLDEDEWGSVAFTSIEEAQLKTQKCIEVMLKEFEHRHLRLLQSLEYLQEGEYAVAFRISADGDFHYIRRYNNGRWFHKRGNAPVIESITTHEVFYEDWCGRYNGPLVLLAIQE